MYKILLSAVILSAAYFVGAVHPSLEEKIAKDLEEGAKARPMKISEHAEWEKMIRGASYKQLLSTYSYNRGELSEPSAAL